MINRLIIPLQRWTCYIPPTAWVFILTLVYTLIVYWNTLSDLPRSDSVVIYGILDRLNFPQDISQIGFMELLGQSRFQPLAWLLEYFQIKAFGTHFQYYHIVVVLLHSINGMLVFKLVRNITQKTVLALIATIIFVTLFTNLPIIAWPIGFHSLLSVSLSLLAILILFRAIHNQKPVFLYISYALAFMSLFLYELNILLPGILLLLFLILGWKGQNHRWLFWGNVLPTAIIYLIYGVLYAVLAPRFAGTAGEIVSSTNIMNALAGVPIEFFNTAFLHNFFATSQVVFDELLFYVPFTAYSFAWWGAISWYNFLGYLFLFGLVVIARRPVQGRSWLAVLLFVWAVVYTFMITIARGTAYTISQPRHIYFPALLLIIVVILLYERYFSGKERLFSSSVFPIPIHYVSCILIALVVFMFSLNTAKTAWTLEDYTDYRNHTNAIYYSAEEWLSAEENQGNTLFLAESTYPAHEKLAWGTDIVPYIFINNNNLTLDVTQATHVLFWPEGKSTPRIVTREESGISLEPGNFSITFGIMPHSYITEQCIEILSPSSTSSDHSWWLRLYAEDITGTRTGGKYCLTLGYTKQLAPKTDVIIFQSAPIAIPPLYMTHFVLVKEQDEYGLIINGTLREKIPGSSNEYLTGNEFTLGPLYRMEYRKPYYFGYTFLEFGTARYEIVEKQPSYIYPEIKFQPQGFQQYHLSLNY